MKQRYVIKGLPAVFLGLFLGFCIVYTMWSLTSACVT